VSNQTAQTGGEMNNRQQQMAALAAAQAALDDKSTTLVDEANKRKVGRGSATHAKMVLEFGTDEEKEQARNGFVGLKPLRDAIQKRMPPELLREVRRRNGALTEVLRRSRRTDAELWARFLPMLRGVSELPSPSDMIKVIKSSRGRENTVDQYLGATSIWIQEFENAWRLYKFNKSHSNNSDAGNGDGDAGSQYTKPAA
jgi:hypothetical protein